MARPRLSIDPAQVEELAAIMCTQAEMATVLGCSVKTLERRFGRAIEKGKARAATSLRRKQWQLAEKGNVTMLIWLGKQYLGQSDRPEADERKRAAFEEYLAMQKGERP